MNVYKFLYLMVHLVTPLSYFIVSVAWGHFALSTPILTNVTDNLAILGIYYFLASILWVMNIKTINQAAEILKNSKK